MNIFYFSVPEGLDVVLGGVHGRVVDGEHAGRVLGGDSAEKELAGPVGLLPEQEVQKRQLEDVERDLDLAALVDHREKKGQV